VPNWHDPIYDLDDGNIEHLIERHDVYPEEAEEVFRRNPHVVRRGDVYHVYGQTLGGRYLFMVCVLRGPRIRVISARDMTGRDRRHYDRR
jgi:uncharacterized DUF497 family protein